MCFFKRKTKVDKLAQNGAELVALASKAEILIALAKTEEVKAKLAKIKEEVTYLKTSTNASAIKLQNRIDSLLDDVKIKLSTNQEEKAVKIIDDIVIAIKERENI